MVRFYTDESETCALIEKDLRKIGIDFMRIPASDHHDIRPPSIDCSHGFCQPPTTEVVGFLAKRNHEQNPRETSDLS